MAITLQRRERAFQISLGVKSGRLDAEAAGLVSEVGDGSI